MCTIMASKENQILELFLNEPTKHWHFTNIIKTVKITKTAANRWLKALAKDGIIKRIKQHGKMPYYVGAYENPEYQNDLLHISRFYRLLQASP